MSSGAAPSGGKRGNCGDTSRAGLAAFGTGYAISIHIASCAVVSLIATSLMPDYTGKDISREYDE